MPAEPTEPSQPTDEPLLRVVKGDPTAEELAAVVSAVSSALANSRAAAGAAAGSGRAGDTGAHGWSAYWRRLRQPVRPGPGAWRASGLPS